MKRIFLTTALFWLVFTCGSHAQNLSSGLGTFERATLSIVNWIKSVSRSLDDFVVKEKRSQFLERLHDLNESLYKVETAKRALLADMKQTTNSSVELNRTRFIAEDLRQQIFHLRRSIHEVAVLLREEFQSGGLKVEELLSSTTDEKESWLDAFTHPTGEKWTNNPQLRAQLIARGEKAVGSLRNASLELAKLKQRLSPQD